MKRENAPVEISLYRCNQSWALVNWWCDQTQLCKREAHAPTNFSPMISPREPNAAGLSCEWRNRQGGENFSPRTYGHTHTQTRRIFTVFCYARRASARFSLADNIIRRRCMSVVSLSLPRCSGDECEHAWPVRVTLVIYLFSLVDPPPLLLCSLPIEESKSCSRQKVGAAINDAVNSGLFALVAARNVHAVYGVVFVQN